jgi:hypothetical protein
LQQIGWARDDFTGSYATVLPKCGTRAGLWDPCNGSKDFRPGFSIPLDRIESNGVQTAPVARVERNGQPGNLREWLRAPRGYAGASPGLWASTRLRAAEMLAEEPYDARIKLAVKG